MLASGPAAKQTHKPHIREFPERSGRDDLIDILATDPKLFMSDYPSGFF